MLGLGFEEVADAGRKTASNLNNLDLFLVLLLFLLVFLLLSFLSLDDRSRGGGLRLLNRLGDLFLRGLNRNFGSGRLILGSFLRGRSSDLGFFLLLLLLGGSLEPSLSSRPWSFQERGVWRAG